ncbi:NAD(P)-binding protein, partial [Candidatus Binatus sp.]|uniref:NAD(P)-binding protein n=1 Tax=Candidatus Binatus sp. TaxID=2811406 RepID=UPI003C355768
MPGIRPCEENDLPEQKPIRVAVIGGGCAAISAAFELSRPAHNGKYQVTIYQLGWRLGGKGASGRGPADRIEEHGLHLWMGSYENAFRLIRECYAELKRDRRKCRIADWRDGFSPAPFIGLAERSQSGAYWNFLTYFPPGDGLPGDPVSENDPFTVTSYLARTASILR